MKKFGVHAVIGKGGMGLQRLLLFKSTAVYNKCDRRSGTITYACYCGSRAEGVDLMQFSIPEARHLKSRRLYSI